jgi:hypothetical protein
MHSDDDRAEGRLFSALVDEMLRRRVEVHRRLEYA